MTACHVCGADCGAPIYRAAAPALTSMSTTLNTECLVYACRACGHAQSPTMADIQSFYDTEYRISLASDDHDQLYEMVDGAPVYRTVKQAELVLQHAGPPSGGRVLDYGAAKAATLRRIVETRTDLTPAVFDVSRDYEPYWSGWIAQDDQATYQCPDDWNDAFDLVTAHFVLEHSERPVDVLCDISRVLKPDGVLFFTVPDPLSNPGDLMVVDHVNHFTEASVMAALAAAGLAPVSLTRDFRGAFVVTAKRTGTPAARAGADALAETRQAVEALARFWRDARDRVLTAANHSSSESAAIYGAGFYGRWIANLLGEGRFSGFLDRNPHVRSAASSKPVFDPAAPPRDIKIVFAGLNPHIAPEILKDWLDETGLDARIIYLDRPPAG